jgi:hypothetical protein
VLHNYCCSILLYLEQGYHTIEKFRFGPQLPLDFNEATYGEFVRMLKKKIKKLAKDQRLAARRLYLQQAATGGLAVPATM